HLELVGLERERLERAIAVSIDLRGMLDAARRDDAEVGEVEVPGAQEVRGLFVASLAHGENGHALREQLLLVALEHALHGGRWAAIPHAAVGEVGGNVARELAKGDRSEVEEECGEEVDPALD